MWHANTQLKFVWAIRLRYGRFGPKGESFACRSNREVTLCLSLILLPSIVPPSVSTRGSQCSTKSISPPSTIGRIAIFAMASNSVSRLARRCFKWVIGERVADDEVDDGFEVSFGSVAFGLAVRRIRPPGGDPPRASARTPSRQQPARLRRPALRRPPSRPRTGPDRAAARTDARLRREADGRRSGGLTHRRRSPRQSGLAYDFQQIVC